MLNWILTKEATRGSRALASIPRLSVGCRGRAYFTTMMDAERLHLQALVKQRAHEIEWMECQIFIENIRKLGTMGTYLTGIAFTALYMTNIYVYEVADMLYEVPDGKQSPLGFRSYGTFAEIISGGVSACAIGLCVTLVAIANWCRRVTNSNHPRRLLLRLPPVPRLPPLSLRPMRPMLPSLQSLISVTAPATAPATVAVTATAASANVNANAHAHTNSTI